MIVNWSTGNKKKKQLPSVPILLIILVIFGGAIGTVLALVIGIAAALHKRESTGTKTADTVWQWGSQMKEKLENWDMVGQNMDKIDLFVQKHTSRNPSVQRQSQPDAPPPPGAKTNWNPPSDHDFQRNAGLSRQQQLDQLNTLMQAGLYSQQEYQAARRKIIQETEP